MSKNSLTFQMKIRVFSVFGTKKQCLLCLILQITDLFFTCRHCFSVKKTKTRFVKKPIVSLNKTLPLFLVILTFKTKKIYCIYVQPVTVYYICGQVCFCTKQHKICKNYKKTTKKLHLFLILVFSNEK